MAAEKSLVLRERTLAELDKVGQEQRGVTCSCRRSEMFFLLSAAILHGAHPVGRAGPGEDASIYAFGQQVSPVHGEERGRPKGDKGDGD